MEKYLALMDDILKRKYRIFGKVLPLYELCFYVPFVIFLTIEMLSSTMITIPGILFKVSRLLTLVSIFRVLYLRPADKRYWIYAGLLLSSAGLIALFSGRKKMIYVAVLMLSMYGISYKKLLKYYMGIVGGLFVITFILSIIGVLENLQFARPTGEIRNSFGFIYTTDFAAHVFYIYMIGIVVAQKINPLVKLFVGFGLAGFIYYFCDARLDAMTIIIGAIFIYILDVKSSWLKAFMRYLPYATAFFAVIISLLMFIYNSNNPVLRFLNNILSGRLQLSKSMLNKEGLNLFGNNIKLVGFGGGEEVVKGTYNFLDSSYIYILFIYGFVFLLLCLFLYTEMAKSMYRIQNYHILIVTAVVALNSMVAHHFLSIHYNILFYLLFASFEKNIVYRRLTTKTLQGYIKKVRHFS